VIVAYGGLPFFVLLSALAVPAVVLGLLERRIKWYGLLATVVMVVALLAETPNQAVPFIAYLALQSILMKAHLWFIRVRGRQVAWERRIAVTLAILPLAIVKVTGLLPVPSLAFIGVSYLTFRATQVIVEISDGLIKTLPLLDYLYFLTFFPALASGPIDRSRRFLQDANLGFDKVSYLRLVGHGLWLVLLGAFYKFALAGYFARQLPTLPHDLGGTVAYMYLYGFDLFFDFAGYSHMAVGVSYIFGIRTPINFRFPFLAENIKDFWNRWHISLSFWFRDFVYTRLLMAFLKRKTFSEKTTASLVSFIVNMLVMGIWHGTTVHYVLYGLYHGLLLATNDAYERRVSFHRRYHKQAWYRIAGIVTTFHLVMFGFLLFSGRLVSI